MTISPSSPPFALMNTDSSSTASSSASKRKLSSIYVPETPISRLVNVHSSSGPFAHVKETPHGFSSDVTDARTPHVKPFNMAALEKTPIMMPNSAMLDRFRHAEAEPTVLPREPKMPNMRVPTMPGATFFSNGTMDLGSANRSVNKDLILAQLMDMHPNTDSGVLVALLQECDYDLTKASSLLMDDSRPKKRKLVKKADIITPFVPAPRVVNGRFINGGGKPPSGKKAKTKRRDSESEESAQSDGSDTEASIYSDNEHEMDAKIFSFVNETSKDALCDMALCSEDLATLITSLGPFKSYDNMVSTLQAQKKGKALLKVLEKCRETLSGYEQVDKLIQICENRGEDIMKVLKTWDRRKQTTGGEDEDGEDTTCQLTLTEIDGPSTPDDTTMVDEPATMCLKEQPSFVNPEMKLKSYQLIGISWLNLLFSMNLGAILADEMGLGKTAQVICFIGLLKDRGIKGPHLIIVPTSTLENWMREIEKWCPELSAVSYYGSQAERAELREYIPDDVPDIVVTTYNVASGQKDDRSFLRKMRFKTMILDEGHMVKNRLSARYKNLDTLKVQFRVLLTGTPLQNNLLELLSLLTFILPGMFEEDQDFLFKVFNTKGLGTDSAANLLSQKRISRARKMMTPFVLRRKKSNVLKELPKKIQNLELCTATESQEALYKGLMADCKKAYADPNMVIEDEPEEPEVNDDEKTKKDVKAGSKKNVSNIIMHLRKAANHPLLFRKHFTDKKIRAMAKDVLKEDDFVDSSYDYVLEDMEYMSDFELHKLATKYKRLHKYELPESVIMDSGKVQKLQMLLPELIGKDCRILLFSQFVIMLDVLESVLNNLGIQFARLDGQTPTADRQVIIDGFNLNPSISVFLLSTKACGLGLNLTSANVVILHDIDFNPHNDAQAEDRAHRVGQTRDVHVYKLILDNTIERHMMNLASVKLNLDKQIHEVDPDGKGEKDGEEDVVPSKETSASVLSMLRQEWLEAEKKD